MTQSPQSLFYFLDNISFIPLTAFLPRDWSHAHFLPLIKEHKFCFLEQGCIRGFRKKKKKAMGRLNTQLRGRALAESGPACLYSASN